MMDIYVALLHYPVRNRVGETVATAVTNLDIHDLARAARTYDVRGTFFVTPVEQQRSLVRRIIAHWQGGSGAEFNPIRAVAFERVHVTSDVEEAAQMIEAETGHRPIRAVTGAGFDTDTIPNEILRRRCEEEEGALLILFGTGWGLTDDFVDTCDLRLPAIRANEGREGYNHLSVRSAVSIILDRLLGQRDLPRRNP